MLPRKNLLPEGIDPIQTEFRTRTEHILIDSTHRRVQDLHHNYRVFFGVRDDTGADSRGDTLKNVVSINVIDAEIPRTGDNIIDGRNRLHVHVAGGDHVAAVKPGLYLSVDAVSVALLDALAALALQDASGATIDWDVEMTQQSRLRVYCSHEFTITQPTDAAEGALAFQLGLTGHSSVLSAPNPGDGMATAVTHPFMIEAVRFSNLMPRAYVDIVIPELPRIGTKQTNSSKDAERVVARVPLGSTPGGAQHYEPGETLMLRNHFTPTSFPFLTVQLYGSDGLPYDSRDTPHRLTLEVVMLADPIIAPPPPPPPPQVPESVTVNVATADRPVNWLEDNKWNVVMGVVGGMLLSRRAMLLVSSSLVLPTATPAADDDSEGTALIARTDSRRCLRYYGAINTESLLQLNSVLDDMAEQDDAPIHLHIQSPGGELLPALYTADLIARSPAPIHTYVDGFAASAATLLAVAGARRYITPHSVYMIHQLSTAHAGRYNDLQQALDNDSLLMEQIMHIYLQHSRIQEASLRSLLATDRFLSASECKELGLVDEIV